MEATPKDYTSLKEKICDVLHIIIIILSLFLVISISIDTFENISFVTQNSYLKLQLYICLFFLFDFFLEFALAEHKFRYFRRNLIFLIISIPYLSIVDYFQIPLSPEASYLMRFVPLIRGGYALVIVVSWLTNNKISGLFVSYLAMLVATVYFSSLIFFVLEHAANPAVPTYADSIWWASMNVTTVGANIYAVTTPGKILTVVLAALGMMMFPIFTVYVTSIFQKMNEDKSLSKKLNPVGTKVTKK